MLGLLIGLAGPRAIPQEVPLYLARERAILINAITWVLASFSFAGLILAHRRVQSRAPGLALLTLLTALGFVPAYLAWQETAVLLRDALFPISPDGRLGHDWVQARDDQDAVLGARLSGPGGSWWPPSAS